MEDLTTVELELIYKNLLGFTSVEMMMVVSKITAELGKRKVLEKAA